MYVIYIISQIKRIIFVGTKHRGIYIYYISHNQCNNGFVSSCKYSITYTAVRSSLGYIRSKHNPSFQQPPPPSVPFIFMAKTLVLISSPSTLPPRISYKHLSPHGDLRKNELWNKYCREQRWKAPDSAMERSRYKEHTVALKTDEKIKAKVRLSIGCECSSRSRIRSSFVIIKWEMA